jgi:serine protease Do
VADAKQLATLIAKTDKNKAVSVMFRRGEWVNYAVIRAGR